MTQSLADEVLRLTAKVEALESARHRRVSPATVVSMLALVVALSGGTAYAAATVGTADIRNGAVTAPKLAAGAVTNGKIAAAAVRTGKIAAGAVSTTRLAPNAVRTSRIADGAVTSRKLAAGAVGSAKIRDGQVRASDLGVITPRESSSTLVAGGSNSVSAFCRPGETLIAGGHRSSGVDVFNVDSYSEYANSWRAWFINNSPDTVSIFAIAYCLSP